MRKKCSKRTSDLIKDEKAKVMEETKKHLKELRDSLAPKKQVA